MQVNYVEAPSVRRSIIQVAGTAVERTDASGGISAFRPRDDKSTFTVQKFGNGSFHTEWYGRSPVDPETANIFGRLLSGAVMSSNPEGVLIFSDKDRMGATVKPFPEENQGIIVSSLQDLYVRTQGSGDSEVFGETIKVALMTQDQSA